MTQAHPDKIAVIADVHGNVDALRAVLADIGGAGIPHIVNLGDHVSGPLAAAETLALIRSVPMVNLRGNHDRWVSEQARQEIGPSDLSAFNELEPEDIAWLRALPPSLHLSSELFACHATPQDDVTYWTHDVLADGRVVARDLAKVAHMARVVPQPILLCGHTHLQGLTALPDRRRILNPGSVGLPAYDDDHPVFHVMEAGSPEARYVRLSRRGDGWDIDFRTVAYDPSRMVQMARDKGRDDWAHALETGRMPTG